MEKVILNIGDVVIADDSSILETVLGSCVAVCLWDGRLQRGGMNHFMVPYPSETLQNPAYSGIEAMRRLFSLLVNTGSIVSDIKAKIFGGGKLIKDINQNLDVGRENIMIAKQMLREYDIPVVKEFTGTGCGIKVLFYTLTGKVFVKKLEETIDAQR
jgi:chemotaxis protein CheD